MKLYRGFRNPSRSFTAVFKESKLFLKRKFQFRYVAHKKLAVFDLLLCIEQITLIFDFYFPWTRVCLSKSCQRATILHQNHTFWTSKHAPFLKRSMITVQFWKLSHKRKYMGFEVCFDGFMILAGRGWEERMVNASTYFWSLWTSYLL